MLVINKNATRGAYPGELRDILSIAEARRTRAWLSRWSQLAPEPTPLWQLPDMAEELGVAGIFVKDESKRSALGSFKALGAPAALVRLILRAHPAWDPGALLRGAHAAQLQSLVVVSATDGNHGRALAAAAQSIGVRCVIVLHKHVSVEREAAIAAFGAEIVRIEGNYDASVAHAAALAQENGWQVVSDTSYAGYEDIPRDVMQGYGILADEVMEQQEGTAMFSHVILQGGVGGLAAGVASYLWEQYGEKRPTLIVVEPRQADCLLQSAINGHASNATGTVDSVMAGLACGETSPLAWRFLAPSVDAFLTIEDGDAVEAMRLLARGSAHDSPIVSGESGAAGIAALRVLTLSDDLWRKVRLDVRSKVLLISTEGATAPSVYRDLVGIDADDVLGRQRAPVRF
ncbi:diaminopropionate ammonia-lyase [Variovorax boronicumulans]|uniref:Diaminopropionate ammonia-lyase n=1 Tax=Variovorax boronicumulans TaxID=436515 RepID=A0AAW8CUX1_9BURK|nr:diaminopropionate ammonia-lyase [Variovorax boronicumulans]MDP9894234.1 diaminopropionate ammonia-lyase [Variovorax boronicumulans]MDQ0054053.1 diaminopropionate ammonia-lyase [Variovorax boronicumulans]